GRPGEFVRMAGRHVNVHVELQALAWTPIDRIEIVVNRKLVEVRDVSVPVKNGVRHQVWDIPLDLTRDAWVVVRTRAEGAVPEMAGSHHRLLPSLALVNPVYLDVDGDGVWSAPGITGGP